MIKYFVIFFSLFFQFSFSQGEANNWFFGAGAGLNFSSGSPVAVLGGQTNNQEGCASISDDIGDLLFYSDGVKVWNRNHQIMQNGSGLLGHDSSTQSATIVRKPGSLDIYYVFTIDAVAGVNGFKYSIVDMSLNGGLGGVTTKNATIYSPTCEKISIVKKSNDLDYWIITHDWNSNAFYAHELTNSGINLTPVVSNSGSVISSSTEDARGYMKISPNGSKLALCSSGLDILELFDFNTTTGQVSNGQVILSETGELYGVEFSTSNERLYVSNTLGRKIYQFNLSATNISASKVKVYESSQVPTALQLGPDGKIYIGVYAENFLGVINNPNNLGLSCNLQINGVDLLGAQCLAGLPAFNQSFFFNPNIDFSNSCVGEVTVFQANANQQITGVNWDFGDGTTSSDINPTHIYNNAGQYTVTAEISSNLGVEVITRDIIVTQPPVVNIPNVVFCDNGDGTYTVDTSTIQSQIVGSQTGLIVNFFDTNNNPIPKPLANPLVTSSQGIKAEIYDSLSPNCIVTINIPFQSQNIPNILLDGDKLICLNFTPQEINAGINDGSLISDYTYQWFLDNNEIVGATNYTLNIQTAGEYSVIVKNAFGCTSTRTIVVTASDIASFTSVQVVDLSSSNTITVTVSGTGNYVYTLDDENGFFQTENVFLNVVEGIHTVYVKDLNGCGVISREVAVLSIPDYFTPNGDGINDYWTVKGLNVAGNENSSLYIFNRFGKLLKQINVASEGWNGTFNGKDAPSDDYWYLLKLNDGRDFRGHFTLKR